jgi:hypothetical protein
MFEAWIAWWAACQLWMRREARRRGMALDELLDWYRHTRGSPVD